jgi:hypothetical protein
MSGQSPPPLPKPGWYTAPEAPGQQEDWDGARWTGQRLPLKKARKPLPTWLIVIRTLIFAAVAAAVVDAVADRTDRRDGAMPAATSTVVLGGDDRALFGDYVPTQTD